MKACVQWARKDGFYPVFIRVFDPRPDEEGASLASYVPLDELYARSDVITLHCSLSPENAEMINKGSISRMKDKVMIINNARGGLINERDLADALLSGKVAGAGLDVMASEPPSPESPLLRAPNCVITPHISWAPFEARRRIMECTENNIRAFLAGSPQNVVNGL